MISITFLTEDDGSLKGGNELTIVGKTTSFFNFSNGNCDSGQDDANFPSGNYRGSNTLNISGGIGGSAKFVFMFVAAIGGDLSSSLPPSSLNDVLRSGKRIINIREFDAPGIIRTEVVNGESTNFKRWIGTVEN